MKWWLIRSKQPYEKLPALPYGSVTQPFVLSPHSLNLYHIGPCTLEDFKKCLLPSR